MSLVYSLKLLADLLFYLTFAGTISALIGGADRAMGNSGLLSVVPFVALSALFLGVLHERGKFKYLSFIPLIPAAIFALDYGVVHLLLLAPAIAYTVYYATTLPYNIKTVGYTKVFRLYMCIVLPICLFFAVNSTFFGAFLSGALGPYLLMFTACGIVLMRMIRHDTEILLQTRFKIMNAIGVAGVIIVGAFLGSPQGVQVMSTVFSFLYFRVLIPIIYLIFMIVGFILFPILSLFGFEEWDVYFPMADGGDMYGVPGDIEVYTLERGWSYYIALIVVIIIIAVVAFYVLRAMFRFLTEKSIIRDGTPVIIERVFLGDDKGAKKKEPRVNHQIRQVYRKFLKLCEKKGITLHQSLTTKDISDAYGAAAKDSESPDRLREIYIESRYGEKIPTTADVKECRELYNRMKKAQGAAPKLSKPAEYL